MDKIKMGDFLQSLRNEKDLTQTDVAEIFAVTPQAVSKWESGQSIPDVEMLEKLSRFYKVSINEILIGERSSTASEKQAVKSGPAQEDAPRSDISSRIAPFVSSCSLLGLTLIFYFASFMSGYVTGTSYHVNATGLSILGGGIDKPINALLWLSLLLILAIFGLGFGFFFDRKNALKFRLAQEIIMWVTVFDYFLMACVAGATELGVEGGFILLCLALIAYIVLFYTLPQNKRKRLKSNQ